VGTINLTEESFESTILKDGIVFVDFWAEWCGPCKMFGPIFEKASEKHPDIVFAKVDTEVEQGIAAAAGISSIPTLMAFRDGVLLFREAGALPDEPLANLIQAIRDVDMEEIQNEIAEQKAKGE
jgi:thioredoxin 1